MDIINVRSRGGVKHMSKAKRLFWSLMIVINIVAITALAMAVDKADKNTVSYNYAPAKAEMFCDSDASDLIFDSVKTYPTGDYEIHATCPICHTKYTIMYSAKSREAKRFIGE
jgi:hypothetical protein